MTRNTAGLLLVAALVLCPLAGCQSDQREGLAEAGELAADGPVAVMRVSGLSCPLCAHNIHQQLMDVPGVRGVRVDLGKGEVLVSLAESDAPSRETLGAAIEESGFGLLEFVAVGGASRTTCASCTCKICSCAVAKVRCGSGCSCRS